jgi:hypothetical protein
MERHLSRFCSIESRINNSRHPPTHTQPARLRTRTRAAHVHLRLLTQISLVHGSMGAVHTNNSPRHFNTPAYRQYQDRETVACPTLTTGAATRSPSPAKVPTEAAGPAPELETAPAPALPGCCVMPPVAAPCDVVAPPSACFGETPPAPPAGVAAEGGMGAMGPSDADAAAGVGLGVPPSLAPDLASRPPDLPRPSTRPFPTPLPEPTSA